ncbi:hypothetical protein [Flavobacterium hungaricum]|uniref:DUF1351 domain-containing protein n=1 Tax=Flavobacterium hungaricum TaxID=2082725 RepID=A0ABR9TRE9_9FLAO|nr:hypothetical protein [Flavobacterium hungaricum]MBE8727948.1 hypothetical protein [Flavobacterium hungaricum]
MKNQVKKTEIISLESVKASMLPELQGWKAKQEAVVEENPFVAITDNKTYEEAKKSRTAYVTARTTIEKQETLIASKLKIVRNEVSTETKNLIDITLPHEEKQQMEVRRYEAAKEKEREEKEKAEKERKEAIQNKIETFYQLQKGQIESLLFDKIKSFKVEMNESINNTDVSEFEEFELQFASKVQLLKQQLDDKVKSLTEKEEARLAYEKLAKEKAEFEAQKKAKEESDKKEAKEREEKQKAIDAENKRVADENAKKQKELDEKQKAIDEAEKKRKEEVAVKEKAEADRIAKEKADKEAKEKEEAEKKRIEELKPDKEKAMQYIESLLFTADFPEIKDQAIAKELLSIRDGLNKTIIAFNNQILNIK